MFVQHVWFKIGILLHTHTLESADLLIEVLFFGTSLAEVMPHKSQWLLLQY